MEKRLLEQYREKLLGNDLQTHRDIYQQLKNEIKKHNIVLIGLRQLGKTILAEQLVKDYLNNTKEEITKEETNRTTGVMPTKDNFLYLNLKSFTNITSEAIQEFISNESFPIVFIDEIQVIENWSNMVQVLVDLNKNTRFIFTGSNASALGKETAFGRVKIFNVFPLNFSEFRSIWNNHSFDDFLLYGSYPKIAGYTHPEIQYKEMLHALIIDKIAIEDNAGISVSKLTNFAKSITNYIGNEISDNKLAKETSISRPTVNSYIKIMKNASLIRTISKYQDKNRTVKNKVYFIDKSMLPYFIGDMNGNEYGSLIENTVFMFLMSKYCVDFGSDEIFYFRNDLQKEIDFIMPKEKILIEVKYHKEIDVEIISDELNKTIGTKFHNYKKIVITKDFEDEINGWKFIPLIKFIGGQ